MSHGVKVTIDLKAADPEFKLPRYYLQRECVELRKPHDVTDGRIHHNASPRRWRRHWNRLISYTFSRSPQKAEM